MEEAALGAITDNPTFGRCINPLGDGLTPGGSSGGSAAALARGEPKSRGIVCSDSAAKRLGIAAR